MTDNTRVYRFEDGWIERVADAGFLSAQTIKDMEFEHGELLSVRVGNAFVVSDTKTAKNKLYLQDLERNLEREVKAELDKNGYIFLDQVIDLVKTNMGIEDTQYDFAI